MQPQDYFAPNDGDFNSSDDGYEPNMAPRGPPPQFFQQNGPPPNPGFMNGGQPPQYGGGGQFPSRGRGKLYSILAKSHYVKPRL